MGITGPNLPIYGAVSGKPQLSPDTPLIQFGFPNRNAATTDTIRMGKSSIGIVITKALKEGHKQGHRDGVAKHTAPLSLWGYPKPSTTLLERLIALWGMIEWPVNMKRQHG
jgi:hypothetical protein